MAKPFDKLALDKQKRIIHAALQEFAEKGYEQASTNTIVKNAGIGKGMLFYYFNNKKELFLYLIDYALQIIKREYLEQIDMSIPDFIERLLHITQVKINYHHEIPDVNHFLSTVFVQPPFPLPEHLAAQFTSLEALGYSMMYDNIDTSLLRDDVDPDKAFQLIRFAIEGYQNQLLAQFKGHHIASMDLDPYWDEFYDYVAILKTCFYK